MTRRDQELLNRQLRALHIPQRRDGTMILAIVTVFLAGLFLGNLHSQAGASTRVGAHETTLTIASGSDPAAAVLR